jgi:hypothetical protein
VLAQDPREHDGEDQPEQVLAHHGNRHRGSLAGVALGQLTQARDRQRAAFPPVVGARRRVLGLSSQSR